MDKRESSYGWLHGKGSTCTKIGRMCRFQISFTKRRAVQVEGNNISKRELINTRMSFSI